MQTEELAKRMFSLDLERQLLSLIISDKDEQLIALNDASDKLFSGLERPELFRMLQTMAEKNLQIDQFSVHNFLEINAKAYRHEPVGKELQQVNNTPAFEGHKNLISHLKEYSAKRALYNMCAEISQKLARNENTEEIFKEATKLLVSNIRDEREMTLAEIAEATYNGIMVNPLSKQAMKTGISEFDQLFFGFLKDRYWVLGSESGVGKTATSVDMIYRLCTTPANEGKFKILFLSFEMNEERLGRRITSRHTGFTEQRLGQSFKALTEEEGKKIKEATEMFTSWPMDIVYKTLSPQQMKLRVQRFAMENPDKHLIIIVDNLSEIAKQNSDQRKGMIDASSVCKSFCIDHKATTIALAHLTKETSTTENKRKYAGRPSVSQLAESGMIRNQADNVLLLWRPETIAPVISYGDYENWQTKDKMIYVIEKNRDGQCPVDVILDCNIGINKISDPENPF